MALIGKIRSNSWLLVVLIGLGLGGFILMDMMSGQQSVFGSGQTLMADIEGKKIDIQEFNRTYDLAYKGVSGPQVYSSREALYNYYIEETILKNESEAIGLGVSRDEVKELFFSPDQNKVSPVIRSRYRNPQTGQFDPSQLTQVKGILEGGELDNMIDQGQLVRDFRSRWGYQEREVVKDRLQSKYVNMVAKGMYTPNWMAEMVATDQNSRMDFAYVQVPFDAVDDSAISLSDADYTAFLAENKAKYTQDVETRMVEFISFPVEASQKDKDNIAKEISNLNDKFRDAANDSTFVQSNYGSISQFWLKKDVLADPIQDTVFKLPVGSVYGPYLDESNSTAPAYKAVKILDRQVMQDSADSRHILIQASTPAQFAEADRLIDSLKLVIETGQNRFDTLAAAFSTDPGSKDKGGEYDFIPVNNFVPEYNDIMFYKGQIGKLYKVKTSYGVHLVEPQGRKGASNQYVRVAYISRPVIPSDETQSEIRERVETFVETNETREAMLAAAAEQGFDVETSPALKRNDYAIGSLGTQTASRDIVRWAFNNDINTPTADVGDVSPDVYSFQDQVNYYTNKYVAVTLRNIRPAGALSIANAKGDTEIDLGVLNMIKAKNIAAELSGISDLNAIAAKYEEVKVDTARNVNLSAGKIRDVGTETSIVSQAFTAPLNQVMTPATGNSGVFVVKPLSRPDAQAGNVITAKNSDQNQVRSLMRNLLIQALRQNADVDDNRAKFF